MLASSTPPTKCSQLAPVNYSNNNDNAMQNQEAKRPATTKA